MTGAAEASGADEPIIPYMVMRRLRGHFASGVTVVTLQTDDGLRGVTVSSFAVASISPPIVLICLEHDLESEALLKGSGAFGVSILAEPQELLSERFAGRAFLVDADFTGVSYHTAVTGVPLLTGAVAWFDCRLQAHHDVGDHTLFLGRVVAAGEADPVPAPLIYFARHYASLTNLRRP